MKMQIISEKLHRIFILFWVVAFVCLSSTTVWTSPKGPDGSNGRNDFQHDSFEEEEEDEEDDEEDEERELTPEEIAAQEAKEAAHRAEIAKLVKQLEGKVGEISGDAGKIKELFKDDNSREALSESELLLKAYIEAGLADKKPNYGELGRLGRELCSKNNKSSLGYYAQGMDAMNARKPNLKKAMGFFSKAKSMPKPYKEASSAYTSCLIKAYGLYAGLGALVLIGGIVAFILDKKKKANAIEKNSDEANVDALQALLDSKTADTNEVSLPVGEENTDKEGMAVLNEFNSENTPAVDTSKLEENKKEESAVNEPVINEPEFSEQKPSSTNELNAEKVEELKSNTVAQPSVSVAQKPVPVIQPPVSSAQTAVSSNSSESVASAPTKKVVRVVKKIRVRKDADGNSYVIPDGQPSTSSYQTKAQIEAELDGIRSITRQNSRPVPPIDSQLDILWGNLSRKALQGHIGLMARKPDRLSSPLGSSIMSDNGGHVGSYGADNRIGDVRIGDVSIDLSEEALKDDLIGKLKMLAISDAELRELFAMRNPAHIPHLIEYVMTKPEPMRLAFVAKELGNYNDPAIIDTLSSLLYHEDERVVLAAIQGLEATKSPSAVIPLCPFLRAEIPLFAQAARTALSKFGAVKIMQALKDLPNFTDIKLKEAGIFVLSRMKGEPVEKILKSLLNDESPEVRIQVILAMSFQKNPVYIDVLREYYRIATEAEKSMTRKAIVYLNGFNK